MGHIILLRVCVYSNREYHLYITTRRLGGTAEQLFY